MTFIPFFRVHSRKLRVFRERFAFIRDKSQKIRASNAYIRERAQRTFVFICSEIRRNGKIIIALNNSENQTDNEYIDRLGKPKASF